MPIEVTMPQSSDSTKGRGLRDESGPGPNEESRPMRVVILPGTYHGWNMGDIAMLVVAIRRLKDLWPRAEITVLVYEMEPFRRHCPEVELVSLTHRDAWLDRKLGEPFMDLMRRADLFLMTGCGAVNDVWMTNAVRILDTSDLALRLGIPTAMVGQGIGPMHDSALLEAAARVLPRVWFIGLREGKFSGPLLARLGVDAARVQVTGDDAIELAYQERPTELGGNIGVNLRRADYVGIPEDVVATCREILKRKAQGHGARLLGLPISHFRGESDSEALRQVFGDPGAEFDDGARLNCPLKIIRQTRDCRVVVTASYHAAVFALAMGVPAIGIMHSDYYRQKFEGLTDLFGGGCAVVEASAADAAREIERQFNRLWEQAPIWRDSLIAAAADQVKKGRKAYESLRYLCAASQNRTSNHPFSALAFGGWPCKKNHAGG
jgi:polysaccharide pyruvyl transferase WcaK-like protein